MLFPYLVRLPAAGRDELLDVAQRLFAEAGYDATTIGQIVAAAGSSTAAFHRHFGSKEDLVEALACRFARATAARTEPLLRDPTLDAFSKLSAFIATMRRHKADSASELRATFEPLFRTENLHLFERIQRAVTDVVLPVLTRIIAEGVAERTFETTDAESAAETIMHLMTSHRELVGKLYFARDPREFQRLSERLVAKLAFTGTVIDRILGLPEGSIELADHGALELLACTFGGTSKTA